MHSQFSNNKQSFGLSKFRIYITRSLFHAAMSMFPAAEEITPAGNP